MGTGSKWSCGIAAALMVVGMAGLEVRGGEIARLSLPEKPATPEELAEVAKLPALKDAKVDVSKLKDWGTKEYVLGREKDGEFVEAGKVKTKTVVEKDEVVLEDEVEMFRAGRDAAVIQVKTSGAKDGALSMRKSEMTGAKGEQKETCVIEVKDGVATKKITKEGEEAKEEKMDYPEDSVSVLGLMRAVTILPREAGGRWKSPMIFNEFKMRPRSSGRGVLECTGEITVTLGDKEVKVTQFLYKDGSHVRVEALVDANGVLREMVFDGRETMRLKEDAAK